MLKICNLVLWWKTCIIVYYVDVIHAVVTKYIFTTKEEKGAIMFPNRPPREATPIAWFLQIIHNTTHFKIVNTFRLWMLFYNSIIQPRVTKKDTIVEHSPFTHMYCRNPNILIKCVVLQWAWSLLWTLETHLVFGDHISINFIRNKTYKMLFYIDLNGTVNIQHLLDKIAFFFYSD